jgi:four helix bundle protein
MKLTRFEDLECWKEATSLAIEIYRISGDGEIGKDYGFRDQLRRSSVSIASNIAEGKERETSTEFVRFLYIAKGSAGELRTQLYIANQIGYLNGKRYQELSGRLERLSGMLANLIKALKRGH